MSPAQLTVEGNGTIGRSPARARINVDIVTSDDAATRSGGKNTTIYNALLARVATLGLTPGDVKTTSYNVSFVPYPPKDLPPEQRQPRYGYITSRSLSLSVAPLENVGKVVDAATAAGATTIGDVSFDLKDRRSAYLAALGAAMDDAKTTASAAATAGNFHILRIAKVNVDTEDRQPGPLLIAYRAVAMTAAEPPTQIAPSGPVDVNAHVTIVYDIR
jgi:uncharacterized protein YggE